MPLKNTATPTVTIIGGGPAGLMAADVISAAGVQVDVYDAMATVGRKFLLAGKSGLNITHSEPLETLLSRYGDSRDALAPLITAFDNQHIRAWVNGLGIQTFTGSSGRIFPEDRKAAPLLRAWRRRLKEQQVRFHQRHRWTGWNRQNHLCFSTDAGVVQINADIVILALGGGSWPRLGSDGRWVSVLEHHNIQVSPLQASNCGFDCSWSEHFRQRFAWKPLKSIALSHPASNSTARRCDLMITDTGVEGGAVYALASALQAELRQHPLATLQIDLTPQRTLEQLTRALSTPRGGASMATHLKRRAGLEGIKANLLRELTSAEQFSDPQRLAAAIKSLPLPLTAPRPIEEAISSAGGVGFAQLDNHLMVKQKPGLFIAGEMLDWDAPTGGYLLTGCLASGRAAGLGVLNWLGQAKPAP